MNVEDSDCWTALIYALKEKHEQVARLLIENDAALRKVKEYDLLNLNMVQKMKLNYVSLRNIEKKIGF